MEGNTPLQWWAPLIGVLCFGVGLFSFVWLVEGRPEVGGLDARVDRIVELATTDRVYFAFGVDALLYFPF